MTTSIFFLYLLFGYCLCLLLIFLGLPSSSSKLDLDPRKMWEAIRHQRNDLRKKSPESEGEITTYINQRAVETGIIDKCGLKKDIKTHLIVINNTHGPALDGLVGFVFFIFFLLLSFSPFFVCFWFGLVWFILLSLIFVLTFSLFCCWFLFSFFLVLVWFFPLCFSSSSSSSSFYLI